jgi:hypothetical protein
MQLMTLSLLVMAAMLGGGAVQLVSASANHATVLTTVAEQSYIGHYKYAASDCSGTPNAIFYYPLGLCTRHATVGVTLWTYNSTAVRLTSYPSGSECDTFGTNTLELASSKNKHVCVGGHLRLAASR